MPRGRPQVERVTVHCFVCGEPISKRKTDAERNISGRFFCSLEHRYEAGSKPRRRQMRNCEQCGAEFYPRHDNPRTGHKQRFCTVACHDEWQARLQVDRTCERCGRTFRVKRSRIEHLGEPRFCGRMCMGSAHIKRPLDRWHNGRPAKQDQFGYVHLWEPERQAPNGGRKDGRGRWVPEHRLVAEQILGRRLRSDEQVHHVNRVKDDNRPENLIILTASEHSAITVSTNWAELRELAEYRRRYGKLDAEQES